jgi:ATP-binding cassette, subfamily B, bacterial PglK
VTQSQPLIQNLGRLYSHISPLRRKQFVLLLVLMILAAFAEVFSIGAVLPFLTVLMSPEVVYEHSYAQPFIRYFGLVSPDQLLLPMTIAFGFAALLAGGMRLLLLWAGTKVSYLTGADLTIKVYRGTLYQPYSVHVSRNSSAIINTMVGKVNAAIQSTIIPVLNIISSVTMLVVTLSFLLVIEPKITIITFGGFGLIYIAIVSLTAKFLFNNGSRIAREHTQVVKLLQEGLGSIRDILLDGTQELYCKLYRKSDLPLRRAQGINVFIGSSPRFGIEALGMTFLAFIVYFLAKEPGGIAQSIPVIGILALGAQRLLPVLQLSYHSWSTIQGARAQVADVLFFLDQPIPDYAGKASLELLPFQHELNFNQLSFSYGPEEPKVLNQIDLSIAKGARVGFIGATGSGKSTLIDIVMGLLSPTKGSMSIDGEVITEDNFRSWQKHIAHVPQSIFLADSSIEDNIALGVPKDQVDFERIKKAAKRAQLADLIECWPKKYQTFVGERGVRLSGGQRQRIGIARALYKQADVLILDEATSSLDSETEKEVMQAINDLSDDLSDDLTIIIVAHRLTTLSSCAQIVELDKGNIKRIGSYRDIVSQITV